MSVRTVLFISTFSSLKKVLKTRLMLIVNHEQSTIYREGLCSDLNKSTSRKANLNKHEPPIFTIFKLCRKSLLKSVTLKDYYYQNVNYVRHCIWTMSKKLKYKFEGKMANLFHCWAASDLQAVTVISSHFWHSQNWIEIKYRKIPKLSPSM